MNTMEGTRFPSGSIAEVRDTYLKQDFISVQSVKNPEKGSFRAVLEKVQNEQNPIRFSRHAVNRLNTRGIDMTQEQVSRLEGARNQAKEKGINDSLVLLDDMAFIVNVPHNTVVTAMDRDSTESSIFTNIDGAVIA